MNKEDANSLLLESFSKGSSTPINGAKNRDEFIKSENERLLELVIEPTPVIAQTGEWVKKYGEFDKDKYEMIAIAGRGDNWLLYNPETKMFSLSYGELNGKITLIGFASDDALAEWRG